MRVAFCAFMVAGLLAAFGGGTGDLARDYLATDAKSSGYGALVENATMAELVLLDEYGIEALLAERRYPGKAAALFSLFGDTKEWQEVLAWYGFRQVVPVVWWYHENDSVLLSVESRVGSLVGAAIESWKQRSIVRPKAAVLNNETRAWMALCAIHESGNNFLGRFSRPEEDGMVRPLASRELIAIGENFFLGGIQAVEEKYRRGDEISAGEAGVAALEAAGLVLVGLSGAKRLAALGKTTKAARTAKVAGRSAKASRTARLALALPKAVRTSRAARWGIYAAAIYGAWRHPELVNGLFDWAAEALGVHPYLLRFVGWVLILAPFLCAASALIPHIVLFFSRLRALFPKSRA